MRLTGKIAAITGGALGIGRATAQLFATEGATVVLDDIDAAGAEKAAGEITARGGKAIALALDVGEAGQVNAFVERIVGAHGRLDVL